VRLLCASRLGRALFSFVGAPKISCDRTRPTDSQDISEEREVPRGWARDHGCPELGECMAMAVQTGR